MYKMVLILLVLGLLGQTMAANLTAITWAHAVNSQAELDENLKNDIMMLEADVVMGHLYSDPDGPAEPVMGHPPATQSDITLKQFLTQVHAHNSKTDAVLKGIKLDFKTIDVVGPSVDSLIEIDPNWKVAVWLNADIIQGPVNNTNTPVNPVKFFESCKNYPKATLSIGWTTTWGRDYLIGEYTPNQIDEMKQAIRFSDADVSSSPITFPVRAGIAAQSKEQLIDLMTSFNTTNDVSLTIWSSESDFVNIKKLRDLIFTVGLDKVYVDVPKHLSDQLHLDDPGSAALTLPTMFLSIITVLWNYAMIF